MTQMTKVEEAKVRYQLKEMAPVLDAIGRPGAVGRDVRELN